MKNCVLSTLCFICAILIFSCTNNEPAFSEDDALKTSITEFKMNTVPSIDSGSVENYIQRQSNVSNSSKTSMYEAPIFDETFTLMAEGSSKLKINNSGINFTYKASNIPHLDPSGHAVTLWAVFFEQGVEIKEENIASMYRVSGHVIGNNGVLNYGGRVNEGQTKDLWYGVPLTEASDKVILVIAKTHGPADPGTLHQQLSELEGGCNGDGPDPDLPCYEFLWSLHL